MDEDLALGDRRLEIEKKVIGYTEPANHYDPQLELGHKIRCSE